MILERHVTIVFVKVLLGVLGYPISLLVCIWLFVVNVRSIMTGTGDRVHHLKQCVIEQKCEIERWTHRAFERLQWRLYERFGPSGEVLGFSILLLVDGPFELCSMAWRLLARRFLT